MSSTEAPFSFTTKINGDLFTIRGGDYFDFVGNLKVAVEGIEELVQSIATIQAAGHAAPLVNTGAPAAPVAPPSTPGPVAYTPAPPVPPANGGWGQPAPAPQAVSVPTCQHGERVIRTGTGAKGPWAAAFCPTPKGTPGQCDPQWLKKGSPEWQQFVGN